MWSYEEWKMFWETLNSMLGEKPVAESVTFAGISNGKRTDAKMAEAYDAELADFYGDHDAEKAKVRNRRRADRKHKVLPKVRKQMRYDRGWNRYLSMPCYGCKEIGIAEYRMNNAESVDRADYQLEYEEDAEAVKREIRFREDVRKEVEYRDSVARMMDKRIKNLTEIMEKLKKMEDPTTWEELDEYADNVEMAYWYMRD